jgi:type IV fimbrial biogenesis protein FimT
MLNPYITRRGFSLIELVVGLGIVAFVLAMAVPSFSAWSQNMQIRNAAESISNGLQYARAEALKRNTTVRFNLTTSVDNSCTLSSTNTNWVVNLGSNGVNDPSSACGATISPTVTAYTASASPYLLQVYSAASTPNAVASMSSSAQSYVVFNSLGQVAWPTTGACVSAAGTATSGSVVCIDVTNPTGGSCVSASGTMTCMRVEVSLPAGQIRMCNPNATAGSPQGC